MTTLTDFLLARIAEDEAFARMGLRMRESVGGNGLTARQTAHVGDLFNLVLDDPEAMRQLAQFVQSGVKAPGEAERILAECEAKRRLLEFASVDDWTDPNYAGHINAPGADRGDVLAALALPYVDHPDYDEAWRA